MLNPVDEGFGSLIIDAILYLIVLAKFIRLARLPRTLTGRHALILRLKF